MKDVLKEKFVYKDKGGEEQVWWDKKLSLGRNMMVGHLDEEAAVWLKDKVIQIGKTHGGKVNWIVDLSRLVSSDRSARHVLKEMNQLPSTGKIAFVGGSAFARAVTNFITTAAGKTDIHHFKSEDEAINWINE